MDPRFQKTALVLAAVFITTAVVLLWLVQRLFKAWGWHDLGTPSRPIRIRSRRVSRLIGLGFVLAGCGFLVWSWHDAHTSRFFLFKMAAAGPAFVGMGMSMVIEAPLTPADDSPTRPSVLAWTLSGLGLALGLLYTHFLETGRLPLIP